MIKIVFNKQISGFQNELEFCKKINNKKVSELDPMFNEFISDLFGNLESENIIKCEMDFNKKKYDIKILINGITKKVSIKKGIKNSVHVEGISSFIHFLIENKIDRKNIINYLKFHYADGTTNGTGSKRLSVEEYKKNHQVEIDEINKEINNESILKNAIYRFVLKGNISTDEIDALIFGITSDFIWIKKQEIVKIILSKKDKYCSTIHFGPLIVQPLDRCLNRNKKYEKRRFCVQIKWYNLADDILESMNNNVMEKSGYISEPHSS